VVHHQAQQQQQPQEAVAGPGHDANDNNAGANGRNNPYKVHLVQNFGLCMSCGLSMMALVAERLQNYSLTMREDE